MSLSSQSSNPRLDFNSAIDLVNSKRMALANAIFPYLKQDNQKEADKPKTKDYNSYFDRLDAMRAKKLASHSEDTAPIRDDSV